MLPVYLVVVGLAMALFVFAMYRGGGADAIRSQLGPSIILSGVLIAFAVAFVYVRAPDTVVIVAVVVAGAAAVSAALLARASRTSSLATWTTPWWILAGVFGLLVVVGAASLAR